MLFGFEWQRSMFSVWGLRHAPKHETIRFWALSAQITLVGALGRATADHSGIDAGFLQAWPQARFRGFEAMLQGTPCWGPMLRLLMELQCGYEPPRGLGIGVQALRKPHRHAVGTVGLLLRIPFFAEVLATALRHSGKRLQSWR